MSEGRDEIDWRHEYPWGRKLPEKRIDELGQKKAEVEKKRRLLQDRFQERMIDFERQLERIEADIAIAEKCEADRLRRIAEDVAHKLFDYGIDVFEKIESGHPDENMIGEFEDLYERARSGHVDKSEYAESAKMGVIPEDGFVDPSLVDDDVLTVSELESERP